MKHKMAKAITKQQLWAKTEEHSGVKAKPYITNEKNNIFIRTKKDNEQSFIHLSDNSSLARSLQYGKTDSRNAERTKKPNGKDLPNGSSQTF